MRRVHTDNLFFNILPLVLPLQNFQLGYVLPLHLDSITSSNFYWDRSLSSVELLTGACIVTTPSFRPSAKFLIRKRVMCIDTAPVFHPSIKFLTGRRVMCIFTAPGFHSCQLLDVWATEFLY